ncbi:hypothetical protein TB2_045173 [Malus domestica]
MLVSCESTRSRGSRSHRNQDSVWSRTADARAGTELLQRELVPGPERRRASFFPEGSDTAPVVAGIGFWRWTVAGSTGWSSAWCGFVSTSQRSNGPTDRSMEWIRRHFSNHSRIARSTPSLSANDFRGFAARSSTARRWCFTCRQRRVR